MRRVVAAVALVLAACGGASLSPVPSPAPSLAPILLNVFAAASLKDAIEAAKDAYTTTLKTRLDGAAISIVISTDSSAALRTQIEHGAPADVFLSADTTNPEMLVDADLTDGDSIPFAENELAVIVPADNPAAIATPAALARPGVKVIAAGDEVPISQYAAELVVNLAALPGYPSDFEAGYAANVVSREENVRAILAKVELGEGDAGIVYVTDAAAAVGKVVTIDVPPQANVRAAYAGVVIKGSNLTRAAAHGFLDWLAGPAGQRVLDDFGFLPPGE